MGRRAGAVTVSLDSWHYDLLEFLDCQTEHGDQRRKAYDIFCQVVVSDEFMRRVESNQDWTLVDPYEVRKVMGIELAELWGDKFTEAYYGIEEACEKGDLTIWQKVNAKHVFKQVMATQLETGLPYIAFKDTINQDNPNKHDGYVPCVNLCNESFSNVKPSERAHSCNLVSLNLANLSTSDLEEACYTAVRILDNAIDLTNPPFPESKAHNSRYRTIGVGAMGLADWLAKNSLNYKAINEIDNLFEEMAYQCTSASKDLAKERGAYSAFEGSEWSKGKLLGAKTLNYIQSQSLNPERWRCLSEEIQKYGIRNSHITAIAPNTSSSLVQGCTASILPAYGRLFFDKWSKGSVPIAPPYIKDKFWFYKENKHTHQGDIVNAVATMQQWIDTGISMELVFNLNKGVYFPDEDRALTAKEMFDILMSAWKQGCKAIYYIRTIQKDNFQKEKEECSSCAN